MTFFNRFIWCFLPNLIMYLLSPTKIFCRDNDPINLDYTGSAAAASAVEPPSLLSTTIHMFIALAIVLVLIIAAYSLLRKYGKVVGASQINVSGGINIITSRNLGYRRNIMVVEYKGKKILIGVTPSAISLLTEMKDEKK